MDRPSAVRGVASEIIVTGARRDDTHRPRTSRASRVRNGREAKKVEAGDPVESGLTNKMFTSISEKGLPARIITDNKKITEIQVFERRRKGKQ